MVQKLQPVDDSFEERNEVVGSKRPKSSIAFPYGDLEMAIGVAKTIFDHSGQQCYIHQLASWLNHDNVNSGAFRLKLITARTFNLINVNHEEVILTELGRKIVDENSKRQASVDAFLSVPLYKVLFDRYKGYVLPNDVGLEQEIVTLGVTPKQKDKARQAFQRSAQQAGFFDQGRTKLVLPSGLGNVNTSDTARNTKPLTPQLPTPIVTTSQPSYEGSGGGGNGGLQTIQDQPLLQGLFQLVPSVGMRWPENKRKEWLMLAENIFNMLYGNSDQGED